MRLNDINDIEILRNSLKKLLNECIQNYTCICKGDELKKGEWYFVDQEDENSVYIYPFDENGIGRCITSLDIKTFDQIFKGED